MTADNSTRKPNLGRYWLPAIARVLLGLTFLVFGLNGFLELHSRSERPAAGHWRCAGRSDAGGLLKVVSTAEVLVAVMLLTNRFVPLALALLAPIIAGIITFRIAMAPATIGPGIFVLVMELYLAWAYRGTFRPMLAAKAPPGATRAEMSP